jgi:iron complex outermembrane recepter protein
VLPGSLTYNGYLNQNFIFANQMQGKTYGVEVATVWQMLDWWRWDINYSWLHTQLDVVGPVQTGISPEHRVSLRGALSPWQSLDLDFWFRYVGKNFMVTNLGQFTVQPYVTLDLRAAWRPVKNLELSVTGQNLLQSSHLEYVSETQTLPIAIVRGVYGKISLNF